MPTIIPTTKSICLSKSEQSQLRGKRIEINKILIENGLEPIKDSELAHKIFKKTLPFVKVESNGKIYFEGIAGKLSP